MRISQKAFLSCIVVAGIGLLAAPAAMATGGSCSFSLSFEASAPCLVNVDPQALPSPEDLTCSVEGDYTGIKYTNTGSGVDHVATLVTRNNSPIYPISPTGSQVLMDCTKGDPVTGLGKHSCHETTVKINGIPAGESFWIVVPGRKLPVETSVAAKRKCSGSVKSMAIPGLGLDAPAAPVTETLQHEDCAVQFTLNGLTGAVLSAKLTPDSLIAGCHLQVDDAEDVTVNIPGGTSPLKLKFGQGYFQSGPTSCTTRVIGGKLVTFGRPCP